MRRQAQGIDQSARPRVAYVHLMQPAANEPQRAAGRASDARNVGGSDWTPSGDSPDVHAMHVSRDDPPTAAVRPTFCAPHAPNWIPELLIDRRCASGAHATGGGTGWAGVTCTTCTPATAAAQPILMTLSGALLTMPAKEG